MGAEHPLSRHTQRGKAQLQPYPRRRCRGGSWLRSFCLNEWTLLWPLPIPGGTFQSGCFRPHIPSSSKEVDTTQSWTLPCLGHKVLGHRTLGLDSMSTISCVALGKLLNLSELPFLPLYNAGGNSHLHMERVLRKCCAGLPSSVRYNKRFLCLPYLPLGSWEERLCLRHRATTLLLQRHLSPRGL